MSPHSLLAESLPEAPLLLTTFDSPGIADIFGSTLFLPLTILAIFYFVVMRPQQKEAADLAKVIASLQAGDRVVTASGIHGSVHEARGDVLVLEISPRTYMTVDRESVKRKLVEPGPTAANVTHSESGAV